MFLWVYVSLCRTLSNNGLIVRHLLLISTQLVDLKVSAQLMWGILYCMNYCVYLVVMCLTVSKYSWDVLSSFSFSVDSVSSLLLFLLCCQTHGANHTWSTCLIPRVSWYVCFNITCDWKFLHVLVMLQHEIIRRCTCIHDDDFINAVFVIRFKNCPTYMYTDMYLYHPFHGYIINST